MVREGKAVLAERRTQGIGAAGFASYGNQIKSSNQMIVKVGKQYTTRGGMVATITDDVSDYSALYCMKGFVSNATGNIIRPICMWTLSGSYAVDHPTNFDLLKPIEA